MQQLHTSSIISYAKFIRDGYPKRVAIERIMAECKSVENKLPKAYANRLDFCTKILRFIGLRSQDYKIGDDVIFLRANKLSLLEQFFTEATTTRSLQQAKTPIGAANLSTPDQLQKPKYGLYPSNHGLISRLI